jgi:DNA-binding GntR family transcriptional regulator
MSVKRPTRSKRSAANGNGSSLQDLVVHSVRDRILTGQLQPGDPVLEFHLAQELAVSQSTVREALGILQNHGLVRKIRNVGTFVTQLSASDIRERLRLRIMLEGLAGMEAARFASAEDVHSLEEHRDAILRAVRNNAYLEEGEADLDFHRCIWQQSRDRTLFQILEIICVPLFAFLSLQRRRTQEDLAIVVRSHDPIVEAIRARNADAARLAIQKHIENSYGEFLGDGAFGEKYMLIPSEAAIDTA